MRGPDLTGIKRRRLHTAHACVTSAPGAPGGYGASTAENDMPYASNEDLPASVRNHLPPHAQDIYRAAFNAAYDEYAASVRREAIAHRVAWAAVKRSYVKIAGQWMAQ
jgi:cation transport regulator